MCAGGGYGTTPAMPLNVVKEAVAAKTLAPSGGAACTDPTKKDGDSSGCFSPFQGKI